MSLLKTTLGLCALFVSNLAFAGVTLPERIDVPDDAAEYVSIELRLDGDLLYDYHGPAPENGYDLVEQIGHPGMVAGFYWSNTHHDWVPVYGTLESVRSDVLRLERGEIDPPDLILAKAGSRL